MDINAAFPSKYLKAADLPDNEDTILEIDSVVIEEVGRDQEKRPVIYFKDEPRGMVLNKTNANTITKLYTKETNSWKGKPVALYVTEVQFGSDMVESIRIKTKVPKDKPKGIKQVPLEEDELVI